MSMGSESTYALISKLPFPKNRAPERNASWQLPQNTPVISADNHLSIGEDIWFDRFPARLKDRAPRVWQKNGVWHVGFDGKSLLSDCARSLPTWARLPRRSPMSGCFATARANRF